MKNVVKLILICQVKDDKIPQLIPFMWINSFLVSFFIILMLINLYNFNEENNLVKIEVNRCKNMTNLIW